MIMGRSIHSLCCAALFAGRQFDVLRCSLLRCSCGSDLRSAAVRHNSGDHGTVVVSQLYWVCSTVCIVRFLSVVVHTPITCDFVMYNGHLSCNA